MRTALKASSLSDAGRRCKLVVVDRKNAGIIFEYLIHLGGSHSDYPFETLEKIGDKGRLEMNRGFGLAAFGDPDPSEETMAKASPINYVSKDTPPMFLWATREDSTVPVDQTLAMALALEEAGVPCETHIFENGDHGLSLADQSCAEAMEQVRPDVAVWIPLAETWLRKRFSLELPEKCPDWRAELGIDS